MKLPVDMNLSPRWVNFLHDAGFEAKHWSGIGAANASDSEIMSVARINDYVVLTHDLDFSAIERLARMFHKLQCAGVRCWASQPNVRLATAPRV